MRSRKYIMTVILAFKFLASEGMNLTKANEQLYDYNFHYYDYGNDQKMNSNLEKKDTYSSMY